MAFKQSDTAAGRRTQPVPFKAGEVVFNEFTYTFSATFAHSGTDKLELGILPAGMKIVDYMVIPEGLGGSSFDIGLMSGTFGVQDSARTVGDDLFDGQALTDSVVRGSDRDLLILAATGADRSIGLIVNTADLTGGAAKKITLRTWITPAGNGL